MNKNNTICTLIQNFLSEAELQMVLAQFNYIDKARKCTVSTLISYLISAAANEWKSLRHAADVGPSSGLVSIDHSSLSKHMKAMDYAIIKRIFEMIVGKLNRATRRTLNMPKTLLSIDSTTITVGKTRLPWAVYHGERSGIKLHVSFTNETATPLKVVETTGLKHDGPIGESLEDKRFILVCDRAYFSINKVDRYVQEHQHFVIRLKDNIQLNRKKTLKSSRTKDSNVTANFTCILGTTKNAVFNQLFAGFTRLFLCHDLPVEWRIGVKEILIFHQQLNRLNTV